MSELYWWILEMYSLIKKSIVWFVLGLALAVCGTWFFWNNISTWFKSITPQIGFVSDVVAYQAAIIAIAIPLSFQIISQISERYQSRIIIRKIESQWHFIILMGLLFINSLLAVFLKFAIKDLDKDWHFYLAWTVLTLFVTAIVTLGYFFYDFLRYVTNTKFLIDKLFVDLERPLNIVIGKELTDKRFQKEQKKFVKSLEGIGDICVFEIKKRNSNEYIIDSLHKIKNYIEIIFRLDNIDDSQLLSISDANSKKYSIFIKATISQLIRLREVSIEVQNVETIKFTTSNLTWLLRLLSQGKNYYDLVDTLLRAITKSQYTNQSNYQELDYTSSFMWYINIVFKNKFNIEYLSLYDENFIRSTREIISSTKTQLFSGLISMLHDGINYNSNIGNMPSNLLNRFYEIYKINRKINKNIRELILMGEQIQTLEELQECRSLYSDTKNTTKLIANDISQVRLQQDWRIFIQNNLYILIILFKDRTATKDIISKMFVKLLGSIV